jgi:crossover junction endonuclease MUS81
LTRLLTLKEFNAASLKQKVSTLSNISFKAFHSTFSSLMQPLSVTNMFAKQLMQLNGLSVEKAEAIVKVYPTPTTLMAAFRTAGTDASQLLSKIECGKNSKRTIGPTISQTLAKLYTQHYFDF